MLKKIRLTAVTAALGAALAMPLSAESAELTLQQAIDRALTNNRTLAASAINLESARRTYENNWNTFLPSVNASLESSLSKSGTLFSSKSGSSGGNSTSPLSITPSISESLSVDATIPNTLKQNELQYQNQVLSYRKQLFQIEQQTAEKFYNLIASQENIAILENSLILASAQLAATTASYRAGAASELEYLQAQYSEHSIIPQVAQAKNQYKTDLNSFKIFLGYDVDDDITLTGTISVQPLSLPAGEQLDQIVEERYSQRFDVLQQELQLEQAELSLSTTKIRTWLPVSLSENVSIRPKNSQDYSQGISVSGSISASIRLNLTGFIPGSSTQLSLQKAEDSVTTAAMNLENTEISARQSIYSAFEKIRQLEQTLELNRESLEITTRQYELSEDSYNHGLLSASQLDDTRQRLQQSQQTVLKAQINYLNSVYSLASELNMSIEEVYGLFGSVTGK